MIRLFAALVVLAAVIAATVITYAVATGLDARAQPSAIEARLARGVRSLAIPRAVRGRTNPVARSADVLAEGMSHYADHCASCHANNGSGDTEMGRGLFPKPPDMRQAATQELTDGELFYIIENGVKLTGMPAWGNRTREGETASWHLVQFIRHMPSMTEAELAEMEDLNPRGRAEWQALEEERRFLSGEKPSPPTAPASPHQHKGASQ